MSILGNGTYEVEFTPNDKGKVRVNVDLEGKPVEGSPLVRQALIIVLFPGNNVL